MPPPLVFATTISIPDMNMQSPLLQRSKRPLNAEGVTTTEAVLVLVDTETAVIEETETEIIGIGAGASYGDI